MSTTVVLDPAALAAALPLARGCYQRALLHGWARLSGAGLRGRARSYAGRYARSRANLLARLTRAGVVWREDRGERGLRLLVLVAPPAPAIPAPRARLVGASLACLSPADADRLASALGASLAEREGPAGLRLLGDAGEATDALLDALDRDPSLPRVALVA